MNKITTLDKINLKKSATIFRIDIDDYKRRAFINMGMLPGTKVEKLKISPAGDPSAYMVRGSVVALRNEDASKITVEEG